MVRLKLQTKKNKKYIKFLEDVIESCFMNQKLKIGFIYERKQIEITGKIAGIDKLNHIIVIERNDGITILPIKNITYIEIIH